MNQPTFTEGPPVPLMVEGLLSDQDVRVYLADLKTHAVVVDVRLKTGPTIPSPEHSISVDQGVEQLLSGRMRAIQVRYRYDAFIWSDTLMSLPNGFRLVRCRNE